MTTQRLEELRVELRAERISYGELVELQGLVGEIDPGDAELLEAAGVPESTVGRLVEPPPEDPLEQVIETCDELVADGIADVCSIKAGGHAKRPSHRGGDYDLAYAQGAKDAARKILAVLGRGSATSDGAQYDG
ncbi:MAG TPA: hypothetical protein VG265_14110 [Gaiellaceae bacterium]|jgi:hypothetical protein|nr:hypothetical protein [Gaiellaceae bacterium]